MSLFHSNMRLLSSSSSSSSTTRFDSRNATASCLAGIWRRILCSGTLPTYPSDHVADETNSAKYFRHLKPDEKKTPTDSDHEINPSLVARLMGLDSMPETNFRTSAPAFVELHDNEFFVLSFENLSESREFRPSKGRRSETGFGGSKQRRRVKVLSSDLNGKEGERIRRRRRKKNRDSVLDRNKSLSQEHFVDDVVLKKKKEKENSLEPELSSEDSSPVSVLDSGQFLVDPKVPVSEDGCCSTNWSSRRKLSLETEDDLKRPSLQRDYNGKSETKQVKYVGSSENQENLKAELLGASWVQKWTFEHQDFQGIGGELESLILGHLLQELVDQFD